MKELVQQSWILCQETPQPLEYYFQLPTNTIVFLKHLSAYGLDLYYQAVDGGMRTFAHTLGTRSAEKWIDGHIITKGLEMVRPEVLDLRLSNGVRICDYDRFDSKNAVATLNEMYEVMNAAIEEWTYLLRQELKHKPEPAEIIKSFPLTARKFVEKWMPKIPELTAVQLNKLDADGNIVYDMYNNEKLRRAIRSSFFGGSAYNMYGNGAYRAPIKYETHVDIHQLYTYILMNAALPNPKVAPKVYDTFVEAPLAIYHMDGLSVKLKRNGFPILNYDEKRLPDDRECYYEDLGPQYLNSIDFNILKQNYEIRNESEIITYVFEELPESEYIDDLHNLVTHSYQKRQEKKGTNSAAQRLYKLMLEYLPGCFERDDTRKYKWNNTLNSVVALDDCHHYYETTFYNQLIGTFITAYGRQCLNTLLHKFPHDKVIGWDTDCVFFAGTPAEIPAAVMQMFGDDMGKLHIDGAYIDVRHLAPKQYYGYENGSPFGKFSGVPDGDEVAALILANETRDFIESFETECNVFDYDELSYKSERKKSKLSTFRVGWLR